ncbi:hypothetical protein [Mucilaginibacter defluvii]|uniref:Uncharacterized protein n=1 Tax=Mucilaginibacter defluvii TaxID=1196019 RepID=A0ABP9FJY0_9SPHI
MNQQGNQAGPSSAGPEKQKGLKETHQTEEEIINGANNDEQLEKLKESPASDPKGDQEDSTE